MTTALILSGGGARAAYQVGVLRGIAEIIESGPQPFDIVCGTSAGAINAAYLAAYAGDPVKGISRLYEAWRSLSASDVYDTRWRAVTRSITRIVGAAVHGGDAIPQSVLDNAPLRALLKEWLDFEAVRSSLQSGALGCLCLTAMNYNSGESVAFYEGSAAEPWQRVHRSGRRTRLGVEHVMASAAIPILFPPQWLDGAYFGDGALRQLHPLSPALHLGARRLFIVGVSSNPRAGRMPDYNLPPTVAQMAGHLLNREFIDNLEADVEHAGMINRLLREGARSVDPRRAATAVDIFVLTPSISFDEVAARYIARQPSSMRLLFRVMGARGRGAGASFASYLMFDGGFCQELMQAGRSDALAEAPAIRKFFMTPAVAP